MKKSLFLSVALLAFAGTAFARDYYDSEWNWVSSTNKTSTAKNSEGDWSWGSPTDEKLSLGIEGFYGVATNSLYGGSDAEDIDIWGANFVIGAPFLVDFNPSQLALSYFGVLGFGYGSYEKDAYNYFVHYSEKWELTHFQGAVGLSLDWSPSEYITISPRARLGLSIVKGNFEFNDYSYGEKIELNDTAMGLYYGVGIGVKLNINEHNAIGIGFDYIGSTARPELENENASLKLKAQAYMAFSVSYTYSF